MLRISDGEEVQDDDEVDWYWGGGGEGSGGLWMGVEQNVLSSGRMAGEWLVAVVVIGECFKCSEGRWYQQKKVSTITDYIFGK